MKLPITYSDAYLNVACSRGCITKFAGISPSTKPNHELIISVKKRTNMMTFSTNHLMDLLTEALVCYVLYYLWYVCASSY